MSAPVVLIVLSGPRNTSAEKTIANRLKTDASNFEMAFFCTKYAVRSKKGSSREIPFSFEPATTTREIARATKVVGLGF